MADNEDLMGKPFENAEPAAESGNNDEQAKPAKRWYVVHTYSGYEKKVRDSLIRRIDSMNMREKIFEVLVPVETEIEFKNGKKKEVEKKLYPGYVLVEMIMADDSWYVVRNTSGVTGFVGPSGVDAKPVPLPEDEVKFIRSQMGLEAPSRVSLDIEVGQSVNVIKGPFEGFKGVVDEVSIEREKIKALLTIFGRETSVELDFNQVEKE
ncbi:MAG: transcription termination/antitermination protein NusG [bacterium]|nr:transcription termination/antitermination protein NusG [bacterium]